MGPSRPNPPGGWGLRAISLSFVVDDAPASPPPLFATLPRKPHPQMLPYLRKGVLSVPRQLDDELQGDTCIQTGDDIITKNAQNSRQFLAVFDGKGLDDIEESK